LIFFKNNVKIWYIRKHSQKLTWIEEICLARRMANDSCAGDEFVETRTYMRKHSERATLLEVLSAAKNFERKDDRGQIFSVCGLAKDVHLVSAQSLQEVQSPNDQSLEETNHDPVFRMLSISPDYNKRSC
jgi:hypothetical protein